MGAPGITPTLRRVLLGPDWNGTSLPLSGRSQVPANAGSCLGSLGSWAHPVLVAWSLLLAPKDIGSYLILPAPGLPHL